MIRLLMMTGLLLAGSAFAAERCTSDRDFNSIAARGNTPEMETATVAQDGGASPAVRSATVPANEKPTQIAPRRRLAMTTQQFEELKPAKLEPAAGRTPF